VLRAGGSVPRSADADLRHYIRTTRTGRAPPRYPAVGDGARRFLRTACRNVGQATGVVATAPTMLLTEIESPGSDPKKVVSP